MSYVDYVDIQKLMFVQKPSYFSRSINNKKIMFQKISLALQSTASVKIFVCLFANKIAFLFYDCNLKDHRSQEKIKINFILVSYKLCNVYFCKIVDNR